MGQAMNAAAQILAEFTPGAAGIWVGVFMFAGWLLREWRETRKLSADDRIARREGYEKQVQILAAENRALAKGIRDLREEYDTYRGVCQTENDQLRGQVIKLEFDLAGMRRKTATLARDIARLARDDDAEMNRLIAQFDEGTRI